MQEFPSDATATRIKNNLVLTLPGQLSPAALEQLRRLVVDQVHDRRSLVVIFDCSPVQYMDRHEFAEVCAISRVVMVLGSYPCLAGLRPGVVKYLIQSDADCSGIQTFLDLNTALDHFSGQETGA